ncbi:MAG: hypothetical protein ABJ059_05790, partial [Hyphomicrobiales bacterium]
VLGLFLLAELRFLVVHPFFYFDEVPRTEELSLQHVLGKRIPLVVAKSGDDVCENMPFPPVPTSVVDLLEGRVLTGQHTNITTMVGDTA